MKLTMTGRLLIAMPILLAVMANSAYAKERHWQESIGKGFTLCDSIAKHLNKYRYPDPIESPNACAWGALAAFPGFSEPRWEDIDGTDAEKIAAKLLRYMDEGGVVSSERPSSEALVGEAASLAEAYRTRAKAFLKAGGKVQFLPSGEASVGLHPAAQPSPGFFQLRYSLVPTDKNITGQCPAIPPIRWAGGTFIADVQKDGPNLEVPRGIGMLLYSGPLLVHNKRIYFSTSGSGLSISVYRLLAGGPLEYCRFGLRRR